MADQDFSALLSVAPDAPAKPQQPAPAAPAQNDFSALLSVAPDAPKQEATADGLFDSLITQESRGKQLNPNGTPLTSKAGAIGIAQVMPGTAKEAAELAGLPYDDIRYRNDADYNKALGKAYFAKQLADFQDPAKALAAYNAGPGAVSAAVAKAAKAGNPEGWLNHLPAETRAYVPAILKRAATSTAQSTQNQHTNSYTAPVEPTSFVGDLWSGLKHGAAVTLPNAAGQAAKFFGAEDTGEALTNFAKSNDTSDKQESAYGKSLDSPWSVRGNVYEAADNSVLSLAPGAAGAAAGFAMFGPPGALIGYGLGSLASLPIFYGSQGQETYEKVKKAQLAAGASPQVAEQQAREAGHLSGSIEAGGEMVADVIPFAKLFKPFAKPAGKVAGTVVKDMFFPTIKQAAGGIAKTEAGEIITEMGQQAGEAEVEGRYGAGPGATWEDTSKVIMPTALMTLVPGLAGAASKHAQVNATRKALENPETSPEVRTKLAVAAAHEMSGVSEDTSRNFALYAGNQIKNNAPIEISDDAFYAAQAAQISPETRVDPSLQPVAKAAAEGGALSKAAMAGVSAAPQQPIPVDPVKRLAELEAIGKGTPSQQVIDDNGNPITIPGEEGRFFTPEEKAEYDNLKGLRDATPGMTQEERESSKVDEIADRVKVIEDATRTGTGLSAFRQEDSPVNVKQFLNDLAVAKSKSTPAAVREQALHRLEFAADWAGLNVGTAPARQSTEAAGPPTRTQQTMDMAQGLPQQDHSDVVAAMAAYRNPQLPAATRQAALNQALEIIGRHKAASMPTQESNKPAAVLGDIPNTEAHFLREADRLENGAYQFKSLGYDQEAQELQDQADSMREKAASARAGELGLEDTDQAGQDISSPAKALSVDEATNDLPRVQIPAATDKDVGDEATAFRRKRKAQLVQLAGAGFDTVERRDDGFYLQNTKTGQTVKLDSPADAQLARTAIKSHIDATAHTAAASPLNDRTEPTEAQIAAGNYKKSDVISINGVQVKIENPAGSTRRGTSPDGTPWETKLAHHYGEIQGTEGADGDKVDVFIGNRPDSNKVFVVDQVNKDGSFDEHKLVFGATSEEDARQTYLANYEPGWQGLGSIKEIPVGDLKGWLKNGSKRPAAESEIGRYEVSANGKTYKITAQPVDKLPESTTSTPRDKDGTLINKAQALAIKAMAGFFGKEVRFFDGQKSDINDDGFVLPDDPTMIHLNIRSTRSHMAVFGHELLHILKAENPKAYAAIKKVLSKNVKDAQGFRAYYNSTKLDETSKAALNANELEELASDINGDLLTDAKFWQQVFDQIAADNGKEAKGIIAQLSAFLQKLIANAASVFGDAKGFNSDRFVKDMDAVRAAYRDALAQWAKGQGITKQAMQAEIQRANQKSGDIKRTTKRADDGLTVEGYHFSQQPRQILSTGFYGSGLRGSDREEIMAHPDRRIRDRLSFYVNKGTGVRPESGVGGIAHKATLTNVYDSDADIKRLKQGRSKREFEQAVINEGYSGYLTRMDGEQPGQVIMLGQQTVKPEILGMRTKIEDATQVPAPQQRQMDLGDKITANKSLPAGQMKPDAWSRILMATMPEEAAQLMDVSALGDKPLYKDELVAAIRKAQPEIKRSAKRAQEEYDAVVAKYKGTDQWLKAPNGNDTLLSERQWVQVRTPSFQAWFGPWEKYAVDGNSVWYDDKGEVSKVVDDNGEPLVVYHGTDKGGFSEFNTPGGKKRGDLGIFTTSNGEMADSYVRIGRASPITADDIGEEKKSGVYALFVNIRNPYETDFEGALWNGERNDQYEVFNGEGDKVYAKDGRAFLSLGEARALAKEVGGEAEPAAEHWESTDSAVRDAINSKNDGAIVRNVIDDGGGRSNYADEPSDIFVALNPNQLKSADYNGGEFSVSNDDIRRATKRGQDPAIGDKTDVSKLQNGRVIPESVNIGSLEKSLELARSKSYRKGRELKKDIQDRVLAAARAARVNISQRTKSTFAFLSKMVFDDAKYALKSNENAVGWYDQKVSRALGALSTIHPEINTDKRARLAFLWALATTSNGLKVDMNFDLAERTYRAWKDSAEDVTQRRMPTNIGIGNAAQAINKGLAAYNQLAGKVGEERLLKFMGTKFETGQIERMLGLKVGGEWKPTPVRGAAILGPKIGNGFFSNLNGYFDALTMDRWLMRTWGRMTGTLLDVTAKDIDKSRKKLVSKIANMSKDERSAMSRVIGMPIKAGMTRSQVDAIAKASQKASMKKDKRELMMAAEATNEFRKAANLHHMTMDGQKEAPSGPAERNWIRAVFQDALEKLQEGGYDMTMSDLQALLWYPERRLYDAAKSDEDVANGYEDDEAPDYANAAYNLAVREGVDKTRVLAAMDAAEARGTVKGEILTDEEKAAMLEEFRSPPEQPNQLVYEVAPDPDNKELTAAWNLLSVKDKEEITKLAQDAVLADIVDAVGAKVGKTVTALGGYEGNVNPNLITEYKTKGLSLQQARALAAAIGITLDQKSVVIADPRLESSNGLVRVTLEGKAAKHAAAIMKAVGDATGAYDFTSRGNNIDILNFVDPSTEAFAGRIQEAIDEFDSELPFVVSFGEVKSELIEKGDYEKEISNLRSGSGEEILQRLRGARDRSREIVEAELRGRLARQVQRPAGSARRADARSAEERGLEEKPVEDDGNVRLDVADDVAPSKRPDETVEDRSEDQPVEQYADEVEPEQAKGRKVSYDVTVEDTGESARMTVDAGDALADYDSRIDAMTKLLECLKK